MSKINACAAGVAIGAQAIMACVPDGDDQQIVRACGPDPAALDSLADWCIDRGIQTVAMASTGVYGLPRFETLEARGIPCCVISASSVQHVPGRKSEV
jgi:transposase